MSRDELLEHVAQLQQELSKRDKKRPKQTATTSKKEKIKSIKGLIKKISQNVSKRGSIIKDEIHNDLTEKLSKLLCDDQLSNLSIKHGHTYYLIDATIEAVNVLFEREMKKMEAAWAGKEQEHGVKAKVAANIFYRCLMKIPLAFTKNVEAPTQEKITTAHGDICDDPLTRWSVPLLSFAESPYVGDIAVFQYGMGMSWTGGMDKLLEKWNVNAVCTEGIFADTLYCEGCEIIFSEN